MDKEIVQLFDDLRNLDLPRESGLDKLKCSLNIGQRVKWYSKDDLAYYNEHIREENDDPRSCAHFRGIVIPRPSIDYRGGELEYDEAVIVLYDYECEKDYPEIGWIALSRILDNEDLVEIFDDED
jgi:hypothetical protein